MSKPPAFQFYASDFYVDTNSWTCTEVGLYMRLLMSEWVNGPLPNDTERLARAAGMDHGNFKKLWCPIVKGKFVENGNGTLINLRLEQVRENQSKFRESQSEKGKRSAKKRWGDKVTGVITTVEPVLQPKGNSSSSTLNLKEYVEDSTELRLASFLLKEIQKNKPDFKIPNLQVWAKDIDLMIRRDRRIPDRIREVIVWSQADPFWKSNILSPVALRKQFDRLELAVNSKKGKVREVEGTQYQDLTGEGRI